MKALLALTQRHRFRRAGILSLIHGKQQGQGETISELTISMVTAFPNGT